MRGCAWLLSLAALAGADEVAFVDVAVVPMDAERVLEHQTVIVRDGRIAAVGAADAVGVPDGATVVRGAGRFLMPGLCDMHVHNWYEEEHLLFLANGVTTVRNMWGRQTHRRWAMEVEGGRRLAPTIHTTGPILDGQPPVWQGSVVVATPEQARREVARQALAGFAAIKIYNRLGGKVYRALLDAAQERGLRVAGHVPWGVGIPVVLELGQDSIEHLDGYFGDPPRWDEKEFTKLARRTGRSGTWNCPTLVAYRKIVPPADAEKLRHRDEMRYVPPRLRATWDPRRDFRFQHLTAEQFGFLRKWDAVRLEATKILHDAGARLLLGTDCGNPFVVAGWSVHEELALLVRAGLSPYEALVTATRNPAAYLGVPEEFGTVLAGRRADLLLLDGNPLRDVARAATPAGVMVRGRWLPRAELERRLAALAASYGRKKNRFEDFAPLPEGEVVRYEISWNGVVVGEERFVLLRHGDGSGTIHGQQVNDPPWSTAKTLLLRFDAEGRRLEGEQVSEAYEETASGTFQTTLDGTRLMVQPHLASWVVAARWLRALRVGEEKSFLYFEEDPAREGPRDDGRVVVFREPDQEDRRVYRLTFERASGTHPGRIVFDAAGIPVERRETLQQGEVVYRRLR